MPTVLRAEGFQVMIFLNDHAPSHVHAFKADGSAVIELGSGGEAASVRTIRGKMNTPDVRRALALVQANIGMLRAAWRAIHGED